MDISENPQPEQENDSVLEQMLPALIGWSVAALVVSILMVTFNTAPEVLGAGFFAKLFAVVVGTLLGALGAHIGDFLRRFAMPTATFTQGGFFSLIFIRLFWMMGPQLVGLVGGSLIGITLILM